MLFNVRVYESKRSNVSIIAKMKIQMLSDFAGKQTGNVCVVYHFVVVQSLPVKGRSKPVTVAKSVHEFQHGYEIDTKRVCINNSGTYFALFKIVK